MQKSVSRFPGQFQKAANENAPVEKGKVTVSEADQLSPVALATRAANRLALPPLQWSHYDSMPATVYAKNTGFTVMIQASFHEETPHISSGPLAEKYNFSQIHFHWGEHDETGSGHSVDGVRYPLEMHVVHVKKDFASLNEARGTRDGIAITVHLFSLREERNTSLDQLMAVLQFIQKPNCCAKLYPSSLAEVVHPFHKDYFLYWGAVPGSSQQHYRIVWLVSRQVLPVSSHQLEQFRELLDDRGKFIWSNSNDPHPLGDRSLFLVSPSDKADKTNYGISRRPTRSVMTLESEKSIELHNAEFKSLVGLQEAEKGSCAICPHPNHAGYKATKPSEDPVKITEGDTSVEESCVDLGTLQEPGFVIKTELNTTKDNHKDKTTHVNITDCGNSCKAKYIPSQDMYSVISAYEEDIHLKRKPLFVRKSDPSTEQACVFLTRPPSVHSARSAPSLTTWGHLSLRKECTDMSDPQKIRKSSEVIVFNTSLESLEAKNHEEVNKKYIVFSDELETAKIGSGAISRNVKDAATQRSGNVQTFGVKENLTIITSQAKPQSPVEEETVTELKKESIFCKGELFDDGLKTEYLLVKQAEPKKSFYKVIGEFLLTPDSKRTFVKHGHKTNEALLSEISDNAKHQPAQGGSSKNKNVVYNKVLLSFPPSLEETRKYRVVENSNNVPPKNMNGNPSKGRSATNPHSKVNVEVQKPITDHQNIGENNDEVTRKYYVTKITPVIKSQQENAVGSSEKKLYYAQPILMKQGGTTEKVCQSIKNNNNIKGENYTIQQYMDNTKKNHIETQYTEDDVKEHRQNLNLATNILVGDNLIDIKTRNSIENIKPSDHLLMRKQVRVVAPDKSTETAEPKGSYENEICVKNYIDSVPSSHKNLKTTSKNLTDPLNPEISVKILQTEKSQKIYQIKENNVVPKQNDDYNMEYASNKQTELGYMNKSQSNNSNHKTKIKLAISIKSHGERTKSNELQMLENLTFDKTESTVNKKPFFPKPEIQKPVSGTHVKDFQNCNTANLSRNNNDEVVIEEELEENTVYSSQKSKKKMTIKLTNPTYKLPSQSPPAATNQLSSQHLVTINKVEVPDPYYLARVPRQPLIEYEALQTGHDQQVETIQTEETTSEVKTIKTYTSIKKGKRTSENDQSVPTEWEPIRSKNTKEENCSKTKTTDSSINNQPFKQPNANPHINASNENTKLNHSNYEKKIKIENVHENLQKVTIDFYQSRNPLDESLHSQHDDKRNEVKNTRIVIGSHQPKKAVSNKETKPIDETISSDENNKSKTFEIVIQQNQTQKYFSDRQDQLTNLRNNVTSSVHHPESENKNLIGKSVIVNDQNTSTQNHENIKIDQMYKSKIKFIDTATSNPSESFRFNSQYLQNQQSQVSSYTDIEEEPTKDTGFDTFAEEGSPLSEDSNTGITSIMDQSTERENLTSTKPNIKHDKSTSNADKDIVYIHRRDPVGAPNLDGKRAKETEVKQESKSENLIKNSQKPSELRKTISENIYQPPKSEELISTHDYDSEEKETDSSHCNVMFKNETKIELPSGQTAHMKSLGQVKFNPTRKSGNQNILRPEARSTAKLTKNQATMTTVDKCCSAIDLREEIFNPNNRTSADTSTSVEDGLNENEYTPANYSPVVIKTDQTVVKICPPLEFIGHWNRTSSEDALLENNGKTVRATFLQDTSELPILRGGMLDRDYVFAELHFHWGRKDCCGAEHIVDDQRYSMEAHFLYFKKDYGSVKEALTHEDGLAMVAIQLNVGGPPHPLFGQLIKDIPLIREAETGVYVPAESLFSWIKKTVEESGGYFSYKGTMTSEPPYVEAVTWLVFQQPVPFCCQQSVEFRKLMSPNGELLLKTHRAPRPLNNRIIIYVPL